MQERNIIEEIKTDFLDIANEVNLNRAIPDVRDGLKPSQRAIIWSAYTSGFSSNKPHVKCAKLDGNTIANFLPHGSAYSTIVRMSQSWLNNICEIDFHGANGSLVGGPEAAASRYTECRLSRASELSLLNGVEKMVVNMIPNFSEDLEWPEVLPAILPRLFVNGSQGIGFCMTQEWEPGNLNEFYSKVEDYIKTGKVTCDNIYPDYPSGGIIVNKKDIKQIYETGKGTVILRGEASIEDNLIHITSLPYQVYAEPLIQKIKDLVNNGQMSSICDIYNKSDDTGLHIEIECSERPEDVLDRLYKLTDLQVSLSVNQTAILNKKPILFTLESYIKEYVKFNLQCLVNELSFDTKQLKHRQNILEGFLIAFKNTDKIIKIVKTSSTSDEARTSLMNSFNLNEEQAKAIISMAIGKLTHSDVTKYEEELNQVKVKIEELNKVLNSEKLQNKEFLKRLKDIVDKFGYDRHTKVIDIDITKEARVKEKKEEEQVMIALTDDGLLKRIPLVNYKTGGKNNIKQAIRVGAKSKFLFISSNGLMYKYSVNKVPIGSMTSTGTSIIDEDIISIFGETESSFLVLITKNNLIKKLDMFTTNRKMLPIIKLDENDKVIFASTADKDTIKFNDVTINVMKYNSKGRGAKGVKCKELMKKRVAR